MSSTPIPPRPVAAVGVVGLCDGQVLLVRRDKEPYRGRWSFPGGSIELGETSREAARREMREETGIEIEVLGVADVIDSLHPATAGRPGYQYVIIDFVAVPAGGAASGPPAPRAASDVSDARWVPLAEVSGYDLTPLALPVLERAVRRYRGWLNEGLERDATG